MNFWFQDSDNVIYNRVTVTGASGLAYNAVIQTSFSAESSIEPVTLQEAKDWSRIDVTDDDTLITMLLTGARQVCENYANLSFIDRTVTAKIHNGLGNFVLPFGPVTGDIAYSLNDGSVITDYSFVDAYGADMTLVYAAGYQILPYNLKSAVLNQIAYMYENRGDVEKAFALSPLSKLILMQVRQVA